LSSVKDPVTATVIPIAAKAPLIRPQGNPRSWRHWYPRDRRCGDTRQHKPVGVIISQPSGSHALTHASSCHRGAHYAEHHVCAATHQTALGDLLWAAPQELEHWEGVVLQDVHALVIRSKVVDVFFETLVPKLFADELDDLKMLLEPWPPLGVAAAGIGTGMVGGGKERRSHHAARWHSDPAARIATPRRRRLLACKPALTSRPPTQPPPTTQLPVQHLPTAASAASFRDRRLAFRLRESSSPNSPFKQRLPNTECNGVQFLVRGIRLPPAARTHAGTKYNRRE